MSTVLTYNFNDADNFNFDSDKIEIVNGKAQLKLQSQQYPFAENFTDDTGFTYDSDKSEFIGSQVQQKSQMPADGLLVATYTEDSDLNYGPTLSSLVGTLNGTPTITSEKLVCEGANGVHYNDAALSFSGAGSLKFKVSVNFSGQSSSSEDIIFLRNPSTSNDRIGLSLSSAGTIRLWLYDNTGATIYLATAIGPAVTWTEDVDKEFLLTWNPSGGVVKLFIDGNLHGTLSPGAWTRGTNATRLYVGAGGSYNSSVCSYSDLVLFDAVTETASYTPGYTLSETLYIADTITCPELEHTNPGTIISFDEFASVESNAPKYTLQIGRSGNYLYWDGSAWSISDGTYDQATSAADFNTHCSELDVDGEIYGQFKVHFKAQNSQGVVDSFTATLTANSGYPTDNPTITPNDKLRTTAISLIEESVTKAGSDDVKYVHNVGGTNKWITGGSVADSNGTYAESSSLSDFNAYLGALVSGRQEVYPIVFLHSDDGTTTPSIESMTFTYNASISDPNLTTLCNLEGFIYDANGPVENEVVYFRPFKGFLNDAVLHKYDWTAIDTTDAEGHFTGNVYVQPTDLDFWEMKVGKQRYKVQLKNVSEGSISNLESFEVIEVE